MNILVTGCSGFIGFHLSKKILEKEEYNLIGIDNLNTYYDVELKKSRLKLLKKNKKKFVFYKTDINNYNKVNKIFIKHKISYVIHLAAQAGVRYSIKNPKAYIDSNIMGFFNIINLSKEYKVKHLLFASTSSVYGNSKKFPVNESDKTDTPLTLYAATKKTNEVIAYSYANIYKLNCTALRFFTVYGPYGRPDMAFFKFVDSIYKNKNLELYNSGNHYRDFTYVDDIINAIVLLLDKMPSKNIPFDVFNIGNGKSVYLKKVIKIIEKKLGIKAKIKNLKLQKGDVVKSHSNLQKLKSKINYKSKIDIEKGLSLYIDWFKKYYNNDK